MYKSWVQQCTVGAETGRPLGLAEQTGSPHCHFPGSVRDPVSKNRVSEEDTCHQLLAYIYSQMYTYSRVHIYTCAHIFTSTHTRVHTYSHVCTHVHSGAHIHTCALILSCIHTCTHAHVIHIDKHACRNAHIHTYSCKQTHIYKHA